MMTAWLKCHIYRCAAHIEATIGGIIERLHFRMRLSGGLGMAFADNLVTLDDNATDPRVRRRDEKPFGRPVQGMRNTLQIIENFHESLLKM